MAILGIDEVGRGPWAGPLVVGACILSPALSCLDDLTDSKKLSPRKREALNRQILQHAAAHALGWVSSQELDEIGLSKALRLATRRAMSQIQAQKVPFSEIIIDGTMNFLAQTPFERHVTVLKKADLLIKEVSAASIIAKVARDQYMVNLAQKYPVYGFEKHVGYGTAAHQKALARYGVCPEHRQSFRPIAALQSKSNQIQKTSSQKSLSPNAPTQKTSTTTALGRRAEQIVAEYLLNKGHQIIARNHKTKFYEIDIISWKLDKIYFTEVKYRKNSAHGTPLEFITPTKHQQMRFAAAAYLKLVSNNFSLYKFANLQPVLAVATLSGSDFHLNDFFTLDA